MNKLKEIICANCQKNVPMMCIMQSGAGCSENKEMSNDILMQYISYDDVYNLLQSVQGLEPKHYMQLLENFKKYEQALKLEE